MATKILRSVWASLLLLAAPAFSQPAGTQETVDYLNARLRHSSIIRVTEAGVVRMRTPGETLTFNLKETVINRNDLNGDDRVRIASAEPIEFWDGDHREDVQFRQSFVCRSRTEAREAVEALRRLRTTFLDKDPKYGLLKRKLDPKGTSGEYATLGEAMDFVNDHLSHSVLLKVDEKGIMTFQASEASYRVDLARAEFGLNETSDEPRVRVYGDWCLDVYRDGRKDEETPRESFSVHSRAGASETIRALYGIKAACTGQDATRLTGLRDVAGERVHDYATIAQAIAAINDRLAVSIILGIDAKGDMVVNASNAIYRFNITECAFDVPRERVRLFGLIRFGAEEGVTISSPKGLMKYTDSRRWDTVDEETFSCGSRSASRFVTQALEFIKDQVRKGSKA